MQLGSWGAVKVNPKTLANGDAVWTPQKIYMAAALPLKRLARPPSQKLIVLLVGYLEMQLQNQSFLGDQIHQIWSLLLSAVAP